jgi:glycerate dehydrogenase
LDAPNCVITPHIAWTSLEARERLMEATAEHIEAYLDGEPIHVVNGA